MRNRFFSLIAIFLNSLVRTGNCMFSYGSYKAAVVEYGTIREPFFQPDDILKYNSEEYIKFIQSASTKGASIIIFPEYGLTSTEVSTKSRQQLNGYSIEIPNLVHKPNPCINESLHKVLRLISCAASDNKIYVVVNIVEKEREGGDNIYFNTNLVFDRKGTIILKYRKANLYNETYFDEGNDLATFTTDFGVTFAILIGFDIFYKNPALDVLEEKNVTNVIYSTAWFSETPFQQALSVQAGYARATGVNLLAAGLSDPANKNGGSGIYLYDGRVAELYISPAKSSKLLVQDVPKIHIKISAVKCNNNSQTMPRFRLGGNLNVGSFSALKENLKGHYIVSLSQYSLETKSTLCNFNGLYCCKFHVVLREKLTPQDPEYKLSLFYGVRRMGTTTVGIRSCGLVACSKYEHHVCENVVSTKPRKTATFAKIEIVGTFDNRPESFDNPITLTYDMTPITEYTYCETLVGPDRVQADMKTTQNLTNLMSFGIRGRIFEYDGLGVGPITNTGTIAFANFMLLILGLISL